MVSPMLRHRDLEAFPRRELYVLRHEPAGRDLVRRDADWGWDGRALDDIHGLEGKGQHQLKIQHRRG